MAGRTWNKVQDSWRGVALCLLIALPAWFLGKRFDVIGGPVFAILIGMVLALFLLQIIESGFNILGISPYLTMALWGTLLLCFIQARGMLGLDRVV